MKVKKFIVAIVVVASMVLGSVTAFATDLRAVGANNSTKRVSPTTNITGESVLTPQQYEEYLEGLSEYDRQRIAEKEAIVAQYANRPVTRAGTRAGTKISIPGKFTMYQQETDTYCIPATVQSILTYINGSSPSQAAIAEETGRDSTKIPGYLNERQDKCYYIYTLNPGKASMGYKLYATIADSKVPASMGISGTTTTNWYYLTNGHSLVVNAIYDDYSYIQFGDPLGGRVDGCPYFYIKSADVVSEVCTRIVY